DAGRGSAWGERRTAAARLPPEARRRNSHRAAAARAARRPAAVRGEPARPAPQPGYPLRWKGKGKGEMNSPFPGSSVPERVPERDGLVAVRAGGNDVDGNLQQLLDLLQVGARIRRQVLEALDAASRLLPARHVDVHRLAGRHAFRTELQAALVALRIAVGDADANGIEAIQHVELGHAQAGNAVVQHRAAQRHGVEPAGAAAATGHGTELVAAL